MEIDIKKAPVKVYVVNKNQRNPWGFEDLTCHALHGRLKSKAEITQSVTRTNLVLQGRILHS